MNKNRVFYLILILCLGYFFIFYERRVTFLIFLTVAIFPLFSTGLLLWTKRKISVELVAEPYMVTKQEDCKVIVRIKNQSLFPISKLEVNVFYCNHMLVGREAKTITLSFLGKSSQEVELHLIPEYVGNVELMIDQLTVWEFSHCVKLHKKVQIQGNLMVLPRELKINQNLHIGNWNLFENEAVLLPKPGADQTELLNIREYLEGDRISRIHWKLSDKYDELMIKEYASPLYYYPLFLLDLRKPYKEDVMDYMDAFYEAFISIAIWHIEQEQPLEAAFYDIKQNRLMKKVISTREELYDFIHECYDNSYQAEESKSLQAFYALNEAHRYSNVIYFTPEIESGLQILQNMAIYCVYFIEHTVTDEEYAEVQKNIGYGNTCVMNIHQGDTEIMRMAGEYLRGSRGEYNET